MSARSDHSQSTLTNDKNYTGRKYSDYSRSGYTSGRTYSRGRSYNSYSDSFESDSDRQRGKKVKSEATYVKRDHHSPNRKNTKGKKNVKKRKGSPGGSASALKQDYVTKRVLSARRLKINELRNEIEILARDLADMKQENKVLKRTQHRTSKALERFEDKESDLPAMIDRHNQEVRVLREQLRRQKSKTERANQRLREHQDEGDRLRANLRKLQELAGNKRLGERDDLARRLSKAEEELSEKNRRVQDLESYVENLKKVSHIDIQKEMRKRLTLENDLRDTMANLEYVETQLKEKQKELEVKNIYHQSMGRAQRGDLTALETSSLASFRSTPRGSPRKEVEISPREKARQWELSRRAIEKKKREKPLGLPKPKATLQPPVLEEGVSGPDDQEKEVEQFERNKKQLAILEAKREHIRVSPRQPPSPRSTPQKNPIPSPPRARDVEPSPPLAAQREDSWTAIYKAQDKITSQPDTRRDINSRQPGLSHENNIRNSSAGRGDGFLMSDQESLRRQEEKSMVEATFVKDNSVLTESVFPTEVPDEPKGRVTAERAERKRLQEEGRRQDRERVESARREEERREAFRQQQTQEAQQRQRRREEEERQEAERRIQQAKQEQERQRQFASQGMSEERKRKDQLLAKMKAIDQGSTNGHGSGGDFFITNLDSEEVGQKSIRKEYNHRAADKKLHNGLSAQPTKDVRLKKLLFNSSDGPNPTASAPEPELQKRPSFLSNNDDKDEFSYKPSFGGGGSKGSSKKPKQKANLIDNLFGEEPSKTTKKSGLAGSDIFTDSTKAKPVSDKKAYPWEAEVKSSTTGNKDKGSGAFGTRPIGSKSSVKEDTFFDDDIEEVLL